MKKITRGLYVFLGIIFLIFVAGCVEDRDEGQVPDEDESPEGPESPEAGEISVEVVEVPESVEPGESFEIRWQVKSPVAKEIPHTAVHYGPESMSGELTPQSYPFLTVPQKGTIPAEFEDGLTLEEAGAVYFRAHVIVDGENYWSEERTIEVLGPEIAEEAEAYMKTVSGAAPVVEVLDYPANVESGGPYTIRWEVTGTNSAEISETSILSGPSSGNASLKAYPSRSASQSGRSHGEFEARLKAPLAGNIYFRAYAVVEAVEVFFREYRVRVPGPSAY